MWNPNLWADALQLIEMVFAGAQAAIAAGVGGTQDAKHVNAVFSVVQAILNVHAAAQAAQPAGATAGTANSPLPTIAAASGSSTPTAVTLTPDQSLVVQARGQG